MNQSPLLLFCRGEPGAAESGLKLGRASRLASYRLGESLPHEARREPRPPGVLVSYNQLDKGF
ncbi:MAG: hypothetical protein DMG05_28180, partial [Acidobacteria bacterium]